MIAAAVPLLALLAPLLADTVITRQGRRLEGRILDYPRHIEVVAADGKKTLLAKSDIQQIEIAPNLIECPEIAPFPYDLTEKASYDYFSFERTLLCLPRPPGRKAVAIDILPKVQKVWDLDVPDRAGEAVFAGRTLHLLQREEFLDDTRKIRIGPAAPVSRKVCRITVRAVDLASGQTAWKFSVENADAKNQFWELTPTAPLLQVTPERAFLRFLRTVWPMDAKGVVDKTSPKNLVTVYPYDIRAQKLLDPVDSPDVLDLRSRLFPLEDQIVVLNYTTGQRFTLTGLGALDGKIKWKTDEIAGRLVDVIGDQAYVLDPTHLYAWSVRTGKPLPGWSVQHSDGAIEAIDHNFVYYYRRRQEPRAILGYDVRKAEKAFEIPMPERDEFRHEMLVGHRLIYTDRAQVLRVFDTLQKKPLWEWKGPGAGAFVNLSLTGSGLTFLKDGRIFHVDLNTGRTVWELRGNFRGLAPIGDAGALVHKVPLGMEILRRRGPPPEGARFFTPHGTPLRFSTGEDTWSPPAFADGLLYTLAGSGTCYAIDPREGRIAGSIKAAGAAPVPLVAPAAAGGRLALYLGGSTHVYEAASGTKLFQISDAARRPDRATLTPDGLLTLTGGSLVLSEAGTGKRIWDAKARPATDFFLAGRKAYVLTPAEVRKIDLVSGETEDTAKVLPQTSLVAPDGRRLYAAVGPFIAGEAAPGEEFREIFRSPQQDAKIQHRFRGALAAAGGRLFFSHAAGEIIALNPDAREEAKKVLWSFPAPEFTSPLLVHGDRLWFAAPGKGLFGLNAANGSVEWKAEPGDASTFTPILADGKPAFWSHEGWMIVPPLDN